MRVRDLMTRKLHTVHPEDSLAKAVDVQRRERVRHLPVVDDAQMLVGIVSDRDIKRAMPSLLSGTSQSEYEQILEETTVSRIMTRDPVTIAPDATVRHALEILLDKRYGALPVVEDAALVGIISETDFLRLLYTLLKES